MKALAFFAFALLYSFQTSRAEQIGPLRLEDEPIGKALALYARLSSSVLEQSQPAQGSINLIIPRSVDKADALRFFRAVFQKQAGIVVTPLDNNRSSVSFTSVGGISALTPPPPSIGDDLPVVSPPFGGIGAILGVDNVTKEFMIRGALPGSPTEKANLAKNIIIRSVDGISTEGENLRDLVERVRGPVGSTIELELIDPAGGPPQTIKLKREVIRPANTPPAPMPRIEQARSQNTLILLQTNDVLKVTLPEGGVAELQFLSFKPATSPRAPEIEAEYRWKYRSSTRSEAGAGTNQVAGRFEPVSDSSSAPGTPRQTEVPIRIGKLSFGWSQDGVTRAYLHADLPAAKFDILKQFEEES